MRRPGSTTPVAPAGGATLSPADSATKLCSLLTPADLKTATGDDYGAGVADEYGLVHVPGRRSHRE